MGSGSSRLRSCQSPRDGVGTRQRRRPTAKRSLSSILICGASSSQSPNEMEDDPAELLVNSAEHYHSEMLNFPGKYAALSVGSIADLASSKNENGIPTGRPMIANENPGLECSPSNGDTSDKGKCLSKSGELVPSDQSITSTRTHETDSTLYIHQPSSDSAFANQRPTIDAISGTNNDMNGISSHLGAELTNCTIPSSLSLNSSSDDISVENNVNEAIYFSFSDSGSGSGSGSGFNSTVSESPINADSPRDDTLQEVIPSGLGNPISEREQTRQDTSVLHVDMPSVSSDILASSSAEIGSREERMNSRRLFWDAFSRRSSRRHTDSRTFVFPSGNSDNLRSRDRWILDFSGDLFNDGIGGDSRAYESRTQGINERRWHSRSEIWERLRGGFDTTEQRIAVCPRGIHTDGMCSCQSSLTSEESGARAGVSRIVMLAEALFEVLDEIHRQPMSLSLSMVSLPAPESVVDSFPLKTHRKPEGLESGDEDQQCYICLAEYEEGDKIRVLPCYHEYHMSCVDKWLKEIHGVCPLCRGDVHEGFTEVSVSNSETPSL
ncbi:E3 ubiquitin-protein ligase RLIM-like [Olea europaea var. sylvestris]|uniref:E3 ubiquitin-protein ligase RLIM-like n=1 Tax=Olea europaea var. sylvestris TaxID=158386 RepID=UPI000C1D7E06|nr:E3 ubiquitin-protein ligase RLIM-like [Olea europaea var. sylvestris]